jgi:hypothetical protein
MVHDHVGLEEVAGRLLLWQPAAPALGRVRVEQPVLDGEIEDLREQDQRHVDAPVAERAALAGQALRMLTLGDLGRAVLVHRANGEP